jgi:hypothetical protein
MSLKEFWKANKNGYLWASILFAFGAFFVGATKKVDVSFVGLFILIGLPVIFLMGLSIYEFTGGDRE